MINISGAPPNSLVYTPPYYDNYSGPANPACYLTLDSANDWAGQSFTTSLKYNLLTVELWLKKEGSDFGNIDVELYAVDGSGHPTGSPLNSGVIAYADIPEDYAWVSCDLNVMRLTAQIVSASTKYCIVVHGSELNGDRKLYWACGGDGSDYPNGDQEWSIDGGSSWSTDTTRDQLFRCYPTPWLDNYSGTLLGYSTSLLNHPDDWAGNSFTAMKSYSLDRIDMFIRKNIGDNVGNVVVALYDTDEGKPTGPVLTSGIIPDSAVPWENCEWVKCDVPVYNVSVGVKYAALMHGSSLNAANVINMMWDGKPGPASDYAGGDFLWSMTGGGSWLVQTDRDHLFRCYD